MSGTLAIYSHGDLAVLGEEIGRARKRFGLPEGARVLSCCEAGRDGFWLRRCLNAHGVENVVADAASIEVPRWARPGRLDVGKLLTMLIRFDSGEKRVWSAVHIVMLMASGKTDPGGSVLL